MPTPNEIMWTKLQIKIDDKQRELLEITGRLREANAYIQAMRDAQDAIPKEEK